MRRYHALIVAGVASLLLTTSIASATREQTYGPADSPVSWQAVEPPVRIASERIDVDAVLGIAKPPVSVESVVLKDRRPYGEAIQQQVVLIRYELVPVRGPRGEPTASVFLSLAVDVETNGVVCAFTEPAPQWPRTDEPEFVTFERDLQAAAIDFFGETPSPADYASLRSTVTEVLEALWKQEGINPSKTGQIIIRPRFFQNIWPKEEVNGELVPVNQPANMWIVEVLGTPIQEALGELLTSLVVVFFDEDLVWVRSMPMASEK